MSSDIVIEITGLKSLSKFIGLEDTPLYYDNGKFFKVEDNKIVYTDIEWKDISGDIEEAPQIVDLIEDFVKTISGETIQGYIEEHNSSELAHPYIQNAIQEEISARTEADNTLQNNIDTEASTRQGADITLQNNIDTLSDTVSNNYTTLDTKINDTKTSLEDGINDLSDTVSQNYTDLNNAIINSANTINSRINSEVSTLNTAISTETANRQNADNNLQSQIDAIVSSSDVFDIVGTYAELQAYDISTVPINDIIKVLVDSSHNNASTYYRCVEIAGVKSWSYIGSEGAYYTKSESDTKFVDKTTTINKIPLSSNITLTASDVNALPNTTTIEELTTTAQLNALNSGATSAKIGQITTNTNNITTNTNDISVINNKIPSDASSSNKLVTISDLSNMDTYLANKDLSNLTNLGDGVNRAVKGYNEDGNLIYDKKLVADVSGYKHSTFDLSKFTVVGSPNITDDGIYIGNGSSNTNYLTIGNSIDFNSLTNYRVDFSYNQVTTTSGCHIVDIGGLYIYQNGSAWELFFRNGGANTKIGASHNSVANAKMDFYIERNGSSFTIGYKLHSSDTWILESNSTQTPDIINIASATEIFFNATNPSMDLKTDIKITVDGVEVFSGNKTGIDTIKPDDYTVVGTPTISADGVASGFSNSNYINTGYTLDTSNTWSIKTNFSTGSSIASDQFILAPSINGYNGVSIQIRDFGTRGQRLQVYLPSNSAWLKTFSLNISGQINTNFDVEVKYDGATYYFYVNGILIDSLTSSTKIDSTQPFLIGKSGQWGQAWQGSIDLNSFKIYVDGNLVYQPCLKIPYTESAYKHGSKIVDMQYLPRVKDAYEQGYPNRYYALQEDNKLNCSVVGTPTIAGTQASGFSNTSYLRQYFQNLSGKTLKIQNRFLYDSTMDGGISGGLGNAQSPILVAHATEQTLVFYFRGTSDVTFTVPYSNFTANTWYNTEAIITPTKQIFQVTDDNGNVVFKETKSTAQTFDIQAQMATYTIGYRSSTNYFSGTVDLAGFKVFVDGNFVGSPVVAPCVALPMGDIYGEIENLKELKSDLDRISQTKALATGNVANYEEELKQITDRKHSTFDLSKFTVVGSPTITDDGIASGFSNTNYFSFLNNIGTDYNSFEIKCKIKTSSIDVVSSEYIGGSKFGSSTDYTILFANRRVNGTSHFSLYLGTGTQSYWDIISNYGTYTVLPDTEYFLKLSYDGSKYVLSYSLDNSTFTNDIVVNSSAKALFPDVFRMGYNWGTIFHGSYDLKQFSITVDGVEVFSGNKTGIDTIKPDDYTVVGTPTISAEGNASGFGINNFIRVLSNNKISHTGHIVEYCYKNLNIASLTGFPYFCTVRCTTTTDSYINLAFGIRFSAGDLLVMGTGSGGEKVYITMPFATFYQNPFDFKISFNGTTLSLSIYQNGELKSSKSTTLLATPLDSYIQLGNQQYNNSGERYNAWQSSIDLNSFKIYVDGNLVYQPCLKIPYTQSKTGSKIVDAVYRDRVNDMYQQFGRAPYYTIDEENQNFTLPQGELYGLMGQRVLIAGERTGARYWELYSDRTLEQGGHCENGVEYTFDRPFANDTDFIITIPYSAKTATSFTPSQTGDFIAKGLGNL